MVDEGIGSTRAEGSEEGEEGSDDGPAHVAGGEVVAATVARDEEPLVKVSENTEYKDVAADHSTDQPYPQILHEFCCFGYGSQNE